jgi:hypothetical protein
VGGFDGPFLGTEALAAGRVSRRGLRSGHETVYRDVYLPKGQRLTPVSRAVAAWLWSGRHATVAGLSAAALLGTRWIDADLPAELNRASGKGVDGILVHRDELPDDEICLVNGIRATTPARTAFDLGRRTGLIRAVIRLDALSRATGLQLFELDALVDRHRGARGMIQLRRVLGLVDDGAESPQETRTRLLLLDAGLPRPQTQIVACDGFGCPFARIDMGWERWRVGVEYDGAQHWTDPAQRTYDIDRLADLADRGWRIVRVSGDLLRYRPDVIVDRTCDALRAAGCPNSMLAAVECPLNARFSLDRVS